MAEKITVPTLGESVTEATVSKWLKQVGEKVDSDEPLVELETDKVNVEVPSPLAGTLTSIKVKEGDTVEVGALLGEVNDSKSSSKKVSKTSRSALMMRVRSSASSLLASSIYLSSMTTDSAIPLILFLIIQVQFKIILMLKILFYIASSYHNIP